MEYLGEIKNDRDLVTKKFVEELLENIVDEDTIQAAEDAGILSGGVDFIK